MKFHSPSFLHYLKAQLDISFDVYAHNWICYVSTSNKYFTREILTELIIDAMVNALDAPLAAPDGPRQRSLLDAPMDTHIDAVGVTLSAHRDYLTKQTISTPAGERYEYRIDLKALRRLIIATRRAQDVEVSKTLLQGEVYMSDRLLEKRFLRFTGIAISNRRAREIMQALVDQGLLKNNGNLRTAGREVLL
jgi:hypothetical protein